MIETPEPVEPPCFDDGCSATGPARLAAELSRVIHEFAEDLPWPDSQRLGADAARAVWAAGSSAPVPASQSVPAVPVSSTGGKETGEAAETATEALRLPAEVQHRIDEITVGVKAMAKVVHTLAVVVAKSNRPDMAGWLAEVAIAINAGRDWPVLAPLSDSETEWGWKPDPDEPDEVICSVDEQAARERVSRASYRKLACREVGPWIEVTS